MHIYLHEVQEQAKVSVGTEDRIMITSGIQIMDWERA